MSERRGDLVPRPVSRRERVAAQNVIKEARLTKMRALVDKGLHFVDAAEGAGIPFEIALDMKEDDPALREMFLVSKDRPRIERDPSADVLPEQMSPLEMKHEFGRLLWNSGLYRKAAEMVAVANPDDPTGRQIIMAMLKFVSKEMFPKEVYRDGGKKDETTSIEDMEKRLEELRERRRVARHRLEQGRARMKELGDGREGGPSG